MLATALAQWPPPQPEFVISSPPVTYEEYMADDTYKAKSIAIMVSDVQRIKDYPARGWQVAQAMPAEVEDAYQYLISQGYTQYVTPASS